MAKLLSQLSTANKPSITTAKDHSVSVLIGPHSRRSGTNSAIRFNMLQMPA